MSEHLDDFDTDPYVDSAFADLLEDIGSRTSPPPASTVIHRARRRRTTIVAAAASVVLIAGGAAVLAGTGRLSADPGPTGQLPAPHVLDRDAWAAATDGWVDGWKELSNSDSLAWLDQLQDPNCLASMPDNGPEPDRSGSLTLTAGTHAVVFGALADFDDPTQAQTSWHQLSTAISNCSEASLLHQATWDGAQAESYRLDGPDGSNYFWFAREGQAMALAWVAGDTSPLPADTATRVMTTLVAGLQEPDSFTNRDASDVSTGSASGSGSVAAVPQASVFEGDFAQALGSWDSGWDRRGDQVNHDSLPCLSLDPATGSTGGFGSSVGANGELTVTFFADESLAADAYAGVINKLRGCPTPYDVTTSGSAPQVTVASTGDGVAWIVRNGTNIGVIAVQGGHADPPAEVSTAVGAVIDKALSTTTP
jgi:hypothetical protein